MDFRIRTFMPLANADISIPDTILFKFGSYNGWDVNNLTKEDLYQMTIDHFTEVVSDPVVTPVIPPQFP
jgi:hypothetical protein